MKCIYCSNDCKLKERPGGKCPRCSKQFAFEPTTGSKYTDMQFKSAIDAVSSDGAVRFLPEHVYYELKRRKRRTNLASVVLWFIAAMSALLFLAVNPWLLIISSAFVLFGLVAWPSKLIADDSYVFDSHWKRYREVHGDPKGLIVRKPGQERAQPKGRQSQDIEQYSFDRAVICDREETVDVLLANNFHFENNCAVLSSDGYPPRAFDVVKGMLQRNPRLTVYVLHDATPEGCALATKLASSKDWFRGTARVVEVGLRPAHAKSLKGVWSRGAMSAVSGPGITKDEAVWLRGYSLELFAIRPEQIIKRLYKAVCTNVDQLANASTYVILADQADYYVDAGSFSSDASASDGGDDSFG